MLEGKYILIKYKYKYIASGLVLTTKLNCVHKDMLLVSFDNKYFYNLNHGDIIYTVAEKELPLRQELDNVPITLWRKCSKKSNEPVYKEYTIDELDKECVHLVTAINNLPHIETNGSCSGHYWGPTWVDFECDNFRALQLFTYLFNYKGKFRDDWYVSTHYSLHTTNTGSIPLRLICMHRGRKAYKCAEDLAQYLDQFSEVFIEMMKGES